MPRRPIRRRGVAAFIAFVGVFTMAKAILDTRERAAAAEEELADLLRAVPEAQERSLHRGGSLALERRVERLEVLLIVWMAAAAVALLLALLLATGAGNVIVLGVALALAGLVPAALSGDAAPCVALWIAAAVAQIPDRYFKTAHSGADAD